MSGVLVRLAGVAMGVALGLQAATQFVGWTFAWAPVLGAGVSIGPDSVLYPPWKVWVWRRSFAQEEPRVSPAPTAIVLLGAAGGLGVATVLGSEPTRRRRRGWGGLAEARDA